MFGIRFIKMQPTTYLLQYSHGKLRREGQGLAFFYFAPTSSLVAIPLASVDVPFIFQEVTADFQEISIQGQVTYRVANPKQLAQLLNFSLDLKGQSYLSNDPEKLPQRVINLIQVLLRAMLKNLKLREALSASDDLVRQVRTGLTESESLQALGLEVLGLSILAIRPTPETARALEAEVREQLLQRADEAIYTRRNAAVEQERGIKENELNTEIAVENKKREISEARMDAQIAVENKKRLVGEAKMDAERAVQEKKWLLNEAEMAAHITLEQNNRELVSLRMENLKREADAKAYALSASLQALAGIDAKVLQALASMGMEPGQLVALAFRDLAENSQKIGQLNVSPDLLRELLHGQPS